MDLSRRESSILRGVVDSYIRTGSPVASRQVAHSLPRGPSAATIRNVMAKLETEGYLARSHSSAGCVPTDAGLRRYVDTLSPHTRLPVTVRRQLVDRMEAMRRELVEDIAWVAQVAADTTREAGMAMRPMDDGPVLEAVSLVPLGGHRILSVVVTADGTIEKRVVTPDREFSTDQLQRAGNYLNRAFAGMPIARIRERLTGADRDPGPWKAHESQARTVGRMLFDDSVGDAEVEVVGTSNLLHTEDFAEVERIRSLVSTLQDRRRIVKEWRRAFGSGRTQVLIGCESEVTASGDLGMVATLFYRKGRRAGAVGVVGPRRMDYGRIVPLVEFMGDTLTQMLDGPGAPNA